MEDIELGYLENESGYLREVSTGIKISEEDLVAARSYDFYLKGEGKRYTAATEGMLRAAREYFPYGLWGVDSAFNNLCRDIDIRLDDDDPVLIAGKTGTGKEVVARVIHKKGKRRGGRFVPLVCSGLSPDLFRSELWGHVRGAFTGAFRSKAGRVEMANRGTLFLDEVGDMPPAVQAELLRFLDDKNYIRLGDDKETKADVRIMAATSKDITSKQWREEHGFRHNLFYRLWGGGPINLMPLQGNPFTIRFLLYC